MKVMLYADMRSSHATGWRDGLLEMGYDVREVPSLPTTTSNSMKRRRLAAWRTKLPKWLGLTVLTIEAFWRYPSRRKRLLREVADFQPDLIHALRLPYEGVTVLSALRSSELPLVVSVWGLDFSLQAAHDPLLRAWLRKALPRANGLHADIVADHANALHYRLSSTAPFLLAAGNFGIRERPIAMAKEPLVIAPRMGDRRIRRTLQTNALRHYMTVAQTPTHIVVVDPQVEAETSVRINGHIFTTVPPLPRDSYLDLVKRATVLLSPSAVDGMPNTVLEAIALGCIPVTIELPQFARLRESGSTILSVPQNATPIQLARAIQQAMTTTVERAGTGALPPEYRWTNNLIRVNEFYTSVVAANATQSRESKRESS